MSQDAGVDGGALEKLLKLGGPEFLGKMIDLFLENAPKRVETARAGEQAGDLVAVERAVHSLRSSAGNLGAGVLRDLAGRIERMAEEKRSEGLRELLIELQESLARVQAHLEAEKRRLQP